MFGRNKPDSIYILLLLILAVGIGIPYVAYFNPLFKSLNDQSGEALESRENLSWAIVQANMELANLRHLAQTGTVKRNQSVDIGLTYEIALAQFDIMRQGRLRDQLEASKIDLSAIIKVEQLLEKLDPFMVEIESGDLSNLESVIQISGECIEFLRQFTLNSNSAYMEYLRAQRLLNQGRIQEARRALFIATGTVITLIFVLAVIIKVTIESRKDAEKQKENAVRSAEAKARFLASMSHEIRTPLNAMLGFSDLASDFKEGEKTVRLFEYLKNIKNAGHQLSSLVDNILDWSKIESGKMTLDIRPVAIRKELESFHSVYCHSAEKRGIHLKLIIDESFPEYVETDPTRITQILTNLVGNSLKFTDSGKTVSILAYGSPGEFRITVEDHGIGISQNKLNLIFNAFEQAENSTTRRFGGTGLGLSISKELAVKMGGDIEVTSEEGVGSQFTLISPLIEISDTERQEFLIPDEAIADLALSEENVVLLVEDGLLNQRLISLIFEKFGLEIHLASNGLEGVEATRKLKPDLILMDMQMPEMDGIDATLAIRKLPEVGDVPIVFLTANAFVQDREKAINAGVNTFLTKPLKIEDLKTQLLKHLKVCPKEGLVSKN
ncbi:MAG: ATP-binding protein [Verrucomicrobiota bacterium]